VTIADQQALQHLGGYNETFACDTYTSEWIWTHGHVSKRKFKGKVIAAAKQGYLEGIESHDYMAVLRGKVQHGWVLTVAGDAGHCGLDYTTYFITEPLAEGATTYEECLDPETDEYVACEIYDGPHPATWIEPVEEGA
jgi:hypothetical protein